jgi:predicted nuclease of predicted toxin-antitoxin system
MSYPLLLDEMFSDTIAQQLRAKGYDVVSVVAHPALVALPDDQILAYATAEGRALVTANIKDFMPLDSRYRAAGLAHPGMILVSTKTFPQTRDFTIAIAAALDTLLGGADKIQPGQVLFLTRG